MIIFSILFTALVKLLSPVLGLSTPQGFPPALSREEETAQFMRMRERGNEGEAARQKLILHNLRLVSHIVRKYYSTGKDPEDLVSIGTIGLVKAVDTFTVENGAKFATYASRCIQNEILMHFRAEKKHSSEISINETIDVDRDGNPLSYMDVISSDEDISEEVDRKIMISRALRCVRYALGERERQIIVLRYGLFGNDELTQREIAERLHISRSYVSRLEKSALDKLKSALGG